MSELMADPHTKGIAFMVLAGVEAAFLIGCLVCANISKNSDEAEEEENMRKAQQKEYEPVGQEEQIMSWSNKAADSISIKTKKIKEIKSLKTKINLFI